MAAGNGNGNGRKLTEKQRRFVEAYMGEAKGNATEAARLAGYKGNRATLQAVGKENLSKPLISGAVAQVQSADPLVATREERQQFWTAMMKDEEAHPVARLKASELLAKASGDFVIRFRDETPPAILESPGDLAEARRLLRSRTGRTVAQRMAQPNTLH